MSETDGLSPERLDDIQARCDAATPLPWNSYFEGRDFLGGGSIVQTPNFDIEIPGAKVEDFDFIAAARSDIPDLLAEVRRLRAIVYGE